jgi:hypothetical protein
MKGETGSSRDLAAVLIEDFPPNIDSLFNVVTKLMNHLMSLFLAVRTPETR